METTAPDAETLWTTFASTRCPAVRAALIASYAPLVKGCVHMLGIMPSPAMSFEDQLSAGTIGLIAAVDRFDPRRNVKFETFAAFRIRGAVLDAARAIDPLSRAARRDVSRLRSCAAAMEQELGRVVTSSELAGAMGLDCQTCERGLEAASIKETSLFLVRLADGDDQTGDLADLLADQALPDLDTVLEQQELDAAVAEGLARLPERERTIVEAHYVQGLSLREIGRVLTISQSRAYQLHARAIERLRLYLADTAFADRQPATA